MKVGFVSLGCPKNLVDSEVMLGLVRAAGHELTVDPGDADAIVVNTCAFIDSARQESIDAILEMAEHKKTGRCATLVVAGCLAERHRATLQAEIPEIDVTLGTGEVPNIMAALEHGSRTTPISLYRSRAAATARRQPRYLYDADTPRVLTTPRHFAYVKIAEGCDYTCSFCVIPNLRGPYRSRPADSIVREANRLAERGVKELILVSQDTTHFGIDRDERGALARLLRTLNGISGIEWIRLLYLYPTTITDDVLDAMADCDKVCRYVDLPLQHVAAPVLQRMRRPGSRQTYERLLRRVRERVPGVSVRTTFIVGFPGETDADFAELRSFVGDAGFDHVGVFPYSHEEGTTAYHLADSVPAAVKQRRRRELMALQQRLVARAQRKRVGQRARLLVDGREGTDPPVLVGRLESQAPEIDPVVYLTDCDPVAIQSGDLTEVEIVDARVYDLVARPIAGSGRP